MASDSLLERSVSSLSIHSSGSDDWDCSITLADPPAQSLTPRNSVVFPIEDCNTTPGRTSIPLGHSRAGSGTRTLSDLLKLHAEKGTKCAFTQEEAIRVGDVLGEWINSSSSPYEGEDDFFVRGKDDLYIPSRRIEAIAEGRQRGMSESNSQSSRPPSSTSGHFSPS